MKKNILILLLTFMSVFFVNTNNAPIAYAESSNEAYIYNYLREELQLNNAAACAVLSNIYTESTFNPNALGDKGTSFGIVQWHGVRFTALRNYCSENGYDYTTLDGQLNFLDYELKNIYSKVLHRLQSVPDSQSGAYEAAFYFCYNFEIPAARESESVKRGYLASNIYFPHYNSEENTITPPLQGDAYYYPLFLKTLKGDVDCNDKIEMSDVAQLQKVLAELTPFESYGKFSQYNADFNCDSVENMLDISEMQKYIAGLTVYY